MDSSTTQKLVRYVVYMPHNPGALCHPFRVTEDAEVEDLQLKIRDHPDFKEAIEGKRITILQCGNLSIEPEDTLFARVTQWLREHDDITRMTPALDLDKYFSAGPAPKKEKKVDVVVVTDPMLQNIRRPITPEIRSDDARPAKRPRADEGTATQPCHPIIEATSIIPSKRPRSSDGNNDLLSDFKNVKESNIFLTYWKKTWGKSLGPELVTLPESTSDDSRPSMTGDVLPEKPFMELPVTGNSRKKFLVRAEYIRMYDFIVKYFEDQSHIQPPAVVVTGQPGIGKTVWIYYALTRRLAASKPTLFFVGGVYLLFYKDGVKIVPPSESWFFQGNPFTTEKGNPWCLIDSESAQSIPVEVSDTPQGGVDLVYVTSPTGSRWKRLYKTKASQVAIMNPWSWEEIDAATVDFSDDEKMVVKERFKQWGPMARICFGISGDYMSTYNAECQESIKEVPNMATLMAKIITEGRQLYQKEERAEIIRLSHKICLLRRRGEAISNKHDMFFTSEHVASLCAARLEEAKEEEILKVYNLFSMHGDARGMTGPIFEAYVHRKFQTQIVLGGRQMFRSQRGKFYASFCSLDGHPRLKVARETQILSSFDDVAFFPGDVRQFVDGTERIHVQPDTYYQPRHKQQVGIDSFFVHGNYLYLLQITGSTRHCINKGLKPFLKELDGIPNDKSDWRFVFVIPDDIDWFECPKPKISVGTIFTARMKMSLDTAV